MADVCFVPKADIDAPNKEHERRVVVSAPPAGRRLHKQENDHGNAARIKRILLFFQHDETGPYMSDTDLALCKSLERKLIIRG